MKILKLAFAMGGGVSLGSFSGAALTESIKQLIARGSYIDEQGLSKPYDRVVLDVFSGSSAGAISLGILIRVLIGYIDKVHLLAELAKYSDLQNLGREELISKLIDRIKVELTNEFKDLTLSDKKLEQLVSVQIAQDFQQLIWCKKVDILQLTGTDPYKDLINEGGLLDSNFLKKLAETSFHPTSNNSFKISKDGVLADRVLFVSSLTRLEPQEIDGRKESAEEIEFLKSRKLVTQKIYKNLMQKVLTQGVSSYTHKDLRVFDLNLSGGEKLVYDKGDNYPKRWLTVGNYSQEELDQLQLKSAKPIHSIRQTDFWKIVSETCLAAGAFPIAFEPIKLHRFAHEINSEDDKTYHYIDGGTLNNEPIREAFRLSSFLDNQDELQASKQEFDRMIIYVDPFIGGDVSAEHDNIEKIYNDSDLVGIKKIFKSISPILTTFRNEGSIVEIDRALGIYQKFEGRDHLKDFYRYTLDQTPVRIEVPHIQKRIHQQLHELKDYITSSLERLQTKVVIPATVLDIKGEIRRVILDAKNQEHFNRELIQQLSQGNIDSNESLHAAYSQFLSPDSPETMLDAPYFKDWLLALYYVGLDATTDLSGKDAGRTIIPLGPIDINSSNQEVTSIPLGGAPIEGFFGFFSPEIRTRDFHVGQVVSRNILKSLQIIEPQTKELEPIPARVGPPQLALRNKVLRIFNKRINKDKFFLNVANSSLGRLAVKLLSWLVFRIHLSPRKILSWLQQKNDRTHNK